MAGLNRYAYCGNNPVNYIDPSGHFYYGPDGVYSSDDEEHLPKPSKPVGPAKPHLDPLNFEGLTIFGESSIIDLPEWDGNSGDSSEGMSPGSEVIESGVSIKVYNSNDNNERKKSMQNLAIPNTNGNINNSMIGSYQTLDYKADLLRLLYLTHLLQTIGKLYDAGGKHASFSSRNIWDYNYFDCASGITNSIRRGLSVLYMLNRKKSSTLPAMGAQKMYDIGVAEGWLVPTTMENLGFGSLIFVDLRHKEYKKILYNHVMSVYDIVGDNITLLTTWALDDNDESTWATMIIPMGTYKDKYRITPEFKYMEIDFLRFLELY